MFADKLINFYQSLRPLKALPQGIEILFPQKDKQVIGLVKQFLYKYYNDDHPRSLLFGINPGRFGAGVTGVNFTAPKQLKEFCGIDHHLKFSSELSAEFIYDMINAYGGAALFYRDWFISSVCPLGFITSSIPTGVGTPSPKGEGIRKRNSEGKNINYYDDKKLMQVVRPFIVRCINKQVAMGFNTEKCICIGGEKNYKFLSGLNSEYKWFKEIVPLPHPRFILQYRRKQKDKFVHQYLSALRLAG